MAAVQIIFNDLPDGRVEVCVIQRNPDPATPSDAVTLSRIALASLGEFLDLRTIGAGLNSGTCRVSDKLLILENDSEIDFTDEELPEYFDTRDQVLA